MGNHLHLLLVAKDSVLCTRFYGELKKQITECLKRLLGMSSLSLWQKNGTTVIYYKDSETVSERIAYFQSVHRK
jgi:hypothetical protein